MDQRSNQLNDEDLEARSVTFVERDDSDDNETDRIKADIEDTRAEMGQTPTRFKKD